MAKKKIDIELVDIGHEELTQFSKSLIITEENFFKTTRRGVIKSIFHEFFLEFKLHQTPFTQKTTRLYLKSSKYNFLLQVNKGRTDVYMDRKKVIYIDKFGQVYSPSGKKMHASFASDGGSGSRTITFNGKAVAQEADIGAMSGRYFSYVDNKLEVEKYWMFIVLLTWGLIISDDF